MKVKLNIVTSYGGQSLKSGDEIDIPSNIAQRWINKGIAHVSKEEVKSVVKSVEKPIWKPTVKIESKTDEVRLSPQHEILPKITEKNIGKPKISKPKKYNR